MMPSLSLFILCHNRPQETRQVIRSALQQSDSDFQLIISDNSSSDEVENLVRAEFPQVTYRRRVPMLAALAHFNQCIDEAQDDYFCLFHDDDLLQPEFVHEMKALAQACPHSVALACNARIEVFGQLKGQRSFLAAQVLEQIDLASDLAARYFSRNQCGIAPFPAYVYQRPLVGSTRIPPEGGKYADVSWLLLLAHKAPVVWLDKPLMIYRMHAGNDGNTESRRDRLRFLAFLKRNSAWLGRNILDDYRCSFVYKTVQKNSALVHPHRQQVAQAFLAHYRWARYARTDTYVALLRRALSKWRNRQ
jgi:glycosyltransferase involved in cell wall biosynthesis